MARGVDCEADKVSWPDGIEAKREMNRQSKIWLIAGLTVLVLSLALAACARAPATPGVEKATLTNNADGYVDITVQQLVKLVKGKDVTLVNVHIPYAGEIPQTGLFIPYDEIAAYTDELPDKDATIVLYCRSGAMSTSAAKTLVSLGYSNVLEVDGGMRAWESAGYELIQRCCR